MKTNEAYDKEILTAIENNEPAKLKEILTELKTHSRKITECMLTKNYLEEAWAVRAHDDIFIALLDADVDNHANLSEGNSVLYHLVDDSNYTGVKLFVNHGADVNFSCVREQRETHLEGEYDNTSKTCEPIEDDHAEDYQEPYHIEKPLLCAAIEEYEQRDGPAVVKALLAAPNIDLLNHDELHDNALSYAVAHGDVKLLKELVAREPKIVSAVTNNNLLNIAVHNKKSSNLKYLLTTHKLSPNEISQVGAEDSLCMLLRHHNKLAEFLDETKNDDSYDSVKARKELAELKTMHKLLLTHGATVSAKAQPHYDKAVTLKSGFVSKENSGRENC